METKCFVSDASELAQADDRLAFSNDAIFDETGAVNVRISVDGQSLRDVLTRIVPRSPDRRFLWTSGRTAAGAGWTSDTATRAVRSPSSPIKHTATAAAWGDALVFLDGHHILHDPGAVVCHHFRRTFDNLAVTPERVLAKV